MSGQHILFDDDAKCKLLLVVQRCSICFEFHRRAIIEKNMKNFNFDWSLYPLSVCLLFVGFPLKWSAKKQKKLTGISLVLLVAIVSANLLINGPRGIEMGRFKFMEKIHENGIRQFKDSPFLFLKYNPFAIVKLVGIIADMAFFCYVPFVHVTFFAMILLNPNWKKLIGLLEKIQRDMKLDEEFHRKCRRMCVVALFHLATVSEC